MHYADVIARLETSLRAPLSRPLPGAAAHDLLAPRPRRDWPPGVNPARIRDAAALLLIFPAGGRAHLVLTVRADTLERHGGQVSFPGGVVEPGETFEGAALREAHEEVALPLDLVRVIGALTPLDIPVSGFRLHPIVAAAPARPVLHPADGEVARILEIALDELTTEGALTAVDRIRDGQPVTIPGFHVQGHEIWGATAMILAELLVLLGWSPGDAA